MRTNFCPNIAFVLNAQDVRLGSVEGRSRRASIVTQNRLVIVARVEHQRGPNLGFAPRDLGEEQGVIMYLDSLDNLAFEPGEAARQGWDPLAFHEFRGPVRFVAT